MLFAKDRCSCNACFAHNYPSSLAPQIKPYVNHLYEVHIDHLVSVLCASCLSDLKSEINEIMTIDARSPETKRPLRSNLNGQIVSQPETITQDDNLTFRCSTSDEVGGAEGNRTPVRKQLDRTFSGRSLLFTFPRRGGSRHSPRLGSFMMHDAGKAYCVHGHHSGHTLARLVVLPGRMGA